MVRDVSVSCAELKLVMVRVARPRQRSTVQEPGLRFRAQDQGSGGGQVRRQGEKGNWGCQDGLGVTRVRGLWARVC